MFILFFLIWIIFNGNFTLEIALFGIGISGLLYAFICIFMGYSPKKDWYYLCRLGIILTYLGTLLWEIIKANFIALHYMLSSKIEIEPVIVSFEVELQSTELRVLLANSITLTPGTITISLDENKYVVHCLDKELAVGIDQSVFVKLLQKWERM